MSNLEKIELVSLDRLEPAAYNPREARGDRLELLKTSLSKLGFILPLYATPEGHLLSGHQRLTVAAMLGCTHVPVVWLTVRKDLYKQVNLLFNRITNDMNPEDRSVELFEQLKNSADLQELIKELPDKKVNTDEFYPCMRQEEDTPLNILKNEDRKFRDGSVEMCRKANQYHITMPVVVTESGRIVNGLFRAFSAAQDQKVSWGKVVITDKEGELAQRLTNLVSMDFTLENQYADTLRYGAFRRPNNIVMNLVKAMRFFADGCVSKSAENSLANPQLFWANFRRIHGESVMDFGAGQMRNSLILAKKGIDCTNFEPYPVPWSDETALDKSKPCIIYARKVTREFLKQVASGKHWSSIFMNAVLNSVPFYKDRMVALATVHACCSYTTVVYGTTASALKKTNERLIPMYSEEGKKRHTQTVVSLDYEDNVVVGDITNTPKVQKYHHGYELRAMLERFWTDVTIWEESGGGYLGYRCACPKRVSPKALGEVLAHEFDLPYQDGKSLDLVDVAIKAFNKRHGINILKPVAKPILEEV